MPKENPEFLQKKYSDLPGSKPVERAVQKARREGEPIPDKKLARIQTYLDRLEKVVDSENGWQHLKHKLVKEFTINTSDKDTMDKVAYVLYQSEKKRAREQGRTEELGELEQLSGQEILETRKELIRGKQVIQKETLNYWLDYLQKNDADHPMWFRYYVTRNLQKMGALDKEKGEYTKRTKETVAPFPELNAEALGAVKRWLTSGIGHQEFTEPEEKEKRETLAQLINQSDFSKLYAFAQQESAGQLNRESLEGRWIKYNQGSDHHPLEDSLQGKGTGWCTAEGSAYSHLQGGDFYVYYTKGRKGGYTEPRIAIRMENDQVDEVRGVRPNTIQELEPDLVNIAQEQYHSLPGGEKYDKKASDMKRLTQIERKTQQGEKLTKEDLTFFYEIDSPIESFGYGKDPRIQELRDQRNKEEDMLIIFECTQDQIAHNSKEINENTKAYIGAWNPTVLKLLPSKIEHIFTEFPDQKVFLKEIVPDPEITSAKTAIAKLESQGHTISDYSKDMLTKVDWKEKLKDSYDAVSFSVRELFGDTKIHTYAEIKAKAKEEGLDLVPASLAPAIRSSYEKSGQWTNMAMEAIRDRGGSSALFCCDGIGSESWLGSSNGRDGNRWHDYSRFFFVRK